MNAGVAFPAAAVLRHAAAVDDASDRMAQAKSAVHEVTMDSQAYGQLCRFLPGLLSPLFGGAAEVLTDAVDALGQTSVKLRATVTAMHAVDAGNAARLADAGGPGPALPL